PTPFRGERLLIRYDATATNLAGSERLILRLGKNQYMDIVSPAPIMKSAAPDIWEYAFDVDQDAYQIDFAFHNDNSDWDNNSERGWHFRTYERFSDPPPAFSPFIMDG